MPRGTGRLHHREVLSDGAKRRNGLGIHRIQHFSEVGVHKARVEAELLGAAVHDITVRLVNPHQLDVALFGAPEDPAHVAVREAGDYDRHRLLSEAFGSQRDFRICSNSNLRTL